MYKATFDSQGNRITSYHTDVHTDIPAEAVEITEEEQNLYATNEYIRGTSGKPVKKPPYVPTAEELNQQKIDELNTTYPAKLTGILSAIQQASVLGNPTDALKVKYQQTLAEYKAKMTELVGA